MTSVITGGTVSVEDCKKHEGYPDPQYAPTRKVRVELIFTVPEGADGKPYLDGTAAQANAKVAELLGNKALATIAAATVAAVAATPELPRAPAPGSKAALEGELLAKGATAADLGREPQQPAKAPRAPRKAQTQPAGGAQAEAPKADPDYLTASEPAVVQEPASDGLDDLLGEPAKVEPISDLELNTAVQKVNATLKAPAVIRKLLQEFNPDPVKYPQIVLAQVPQERRHEFLAMLKELKAS
jgi:hypothetical protein